jgi:hypothetical protein
VLAEISVGEACRQPGEHKQSAPESLHFGIAESQGRGTLRFDLTRSVEALEGFFCQDAIVRDFLLVLCPGNMFDKFYAISCATSMQSHLLHLSVIYGTAH